MKRLLLLSVFSLFACPGTVTGPQVCAVSDGPGVIRTRCLSCHSVNVTGVARAGATDGVDFDTEADVRRWSSRIRTRTLVDKTMPPGVPLPECETTHLDAYLTALASSACTPIAVSSSRWWPTWCRPRASPMRRSRS